MNNLQGLYEDEGFQEYLHGDRPGPKVLGGQKSKKWAKITKENAKNAKNGGGIAKTYVPT